MSALGALFYAMSYWFTQPFKWVFTDTDFSVSVGDIWLLVFFAGLFLSVFFGLKSGGDRG